MDSPVKTFTIARRRAGVDHDDLVDRWRSTHAANAVEHMRPDGYTLTFFDQRDGRTPYDGMAELRYGDLERYRAHTGGNIPAAVAHDEWADLVELPNTWLRATEHVVVAGPEGVPATKAELAELSYRDRACAEAHQPPDDGFTAMIVLRALPGREVLVCG